MQTKRCFWLIVAAFVIESAWIAVSSGYPMAFDEDFHFGIIKLYAHQWSPFFTHQPAGGNVFGALTTDPSYLYHYLMSFPYRLISFITANQPAQIVCLRFIDIALVAWSLVIFRAILLKTKASNALVNAALLFLILIPVLPLLAGQINYDDLLLPLGALAILTTIELRAQLKNGTMPAKLLLKLGAVCMLTSLVQFEFLPIFAAIVIYVAYELWRRRRQASGWPALLSKSWRGTKKLYRYGYLALFLLGLGLFSQRYGTNLVVYKNPVPQCNQVLTIAQCSAYSPWLRNYDDTLQKTTVDTNPIIYTVDWVHGMFYHSFYVSSGGGNANAIYVHAGPLPIISITAIAFFSLGMVLLLYDIFRGNKIIRSHQPLGLLLFISASYCVALWAYNYHDYRLLGSAVALNGRYLLPVLPPVLLAIGLAYRSMLGNRSMLKAGLLIVVLLLFLQGGGALTFINFSNPNWYWSNSLPRNMNAAAQKIIKPLIV